MGSDRRVSGVLLVAAAGGLAWAWLNGHLSRLAGRTREAIRSTPAAAAAASTGIIGGGRRT